MTVDIVGTPGVVTSWRAATDAELRAIDVSTDDSIATAGLGDRTVVVGWIGTVCDVQATLTVEIGSLDVAPAPRTGCDLVPVPRGVVLTYAARVDATSIALNLRQPDLLPE